MKETGFGESWGRDLDPVTCCLAELRQELLAEFSFVETLDEALERAENNVLGQTLPEASGSDAVAALPDMAIFRDLASIGRSLTFGELAGIDGKPRAAQVRAETDVACYEIAFDSLHSFGRIHPAIYAKILTNIIREISNTVRFSNEALRAFEY